MIESNIQETIESLDRVLDFDLKVEGKKFSEMDNDAKGFLTEWGTLLTKLQPEFIRIEAFFQRKGKKMDKSSNHPVMLDGLKHLLSKLKRPNNSDAFDRFVVNYQDKDGNPKKFDLLSTKSEITMEIDLNKTIKTTAIYELIKKDFDNFLFNRYSNA
jgi:hypothetical protein